MMLEDPRDPLEIARAGIRHAAHFVANYASMVEELMLMRDDDTAKVLHRKLVAQVNAMTTGFKMLAAAHVETPRRDAQAFFDRAEPAPINEGAE